MEVEMSVRQNLQEQFYRLICGMNFDAPYGVLLGQESAGSKARTITFGRRATLDATIRIFSPSFIQIKTSRHAGSLMFTGPDAVSSAETFIKGI